MMSKLFVRRAVSEMLGTAILLATIVGSGIMAAKLANGNVAIALLGNTIPTGAILIVLITIFGPISGAHFNPVVSAAFAVRGELSQGNFIAYLLAQFLGSIIGVLIAHGMFELPIIQFSTTGRTGYGQWLADFIATFGLMLTIFGSINVAPKSVPVAVAVGLYITAAYWFTASTSFANPAVTLARSLTDSFAGIAPNDVVSFWGAQILGAVAGSALSAWLWPDKKREPS